MRTAQVALAFDNLILYELFDIIIANKILITRRDYAIFTKQSFYNIDVCITNIIGYMVHKDIDIQIHHKNSNNRSPKRIKTIRKQY
jgi:hypothetical protein